MPLFSNSLRPSSLPLLALLLSTTAISPAQAGCSSSDGTETCTGAVTGAIVHDAGTVQTLKVYGLTNALDASKDSRPDVREGAAIDLRDPGGDTPEPSDWSDSNRNGQQGIDGSNGATITTTVDFSSGFGIEGPSGVVLGSQGWSGSKGHGADHTDKTARAGAGGKGGSGGDVTFKAETSKGGGQPANISVGTSRSSTFGMILETTGGNGGGGGVGHSKGGFKDAYGGDGGSGGAGGTATVTLGDGHSLIYAGAEHGGSGVGIVVSSQGGDGGNAGKGEVDALDADKAYGGTGGVGGAGGAVSVTGLSASNNIQTLGAYGAVFASSGGNGGKGGEGEGGHDKAGDGGDAGNGGDVTVDLQTYVNTGGDDGAAVFVTSAGGFAGDSGSDSGGIKNHSGNPGDPGEGGTVALTLTNTTIVATGENNTGILVQSVGGKGGNGGASSGFITYGSKGGSGGAGGKATSTLQGSTDVETFGDHSSALLVQSIGGGGGNAGKAKGLVSLGAEGGAGGVGGAASANLTDSTLKTKGVNSDVVMIQSIGGGGGKSAGGDGLVSVGGGGGLGGDGGAVSMTGQNLTVRSGGTSSTGLYLSSVGGSGGKAHSVKGAIEIGGDGGGGGNGGAVSLTSGSKGMNVQTTGDHSDGVFLQSVGGGGGKAASTLNALDVFAPTVGASGGDGGTGGAITFTGSDADQISTKGYAARGFVAQSIGGGGGVGGNTVSVNLGIKINSNVAGKTGGDGNHGGTVSGTLAGTVTTQGNSATGALIQSLGKGGGAAGNDIQAGLSLELNHDLGSSGGGGGDGGVVDFTNHASITTGGHDADAILAQSVGQGGGHSSNIVDVNVGTQLSTYGNQGASGGDGGDGGQVTVISSGALTTSGDMSNGILAQSVSGGGGKGGQTVNGDLGTSIADVTLGQSGGEAGKTGKVTVTNSGKISTGGTAASAIVAQAIAHGGGQAGKTINGDAGLTVNYTHGGSGGAGGTASDVEVHNSNTLITKGDRSYGIIVQSLGGKGGNGAVTVAGDLSIVGAVNIGVGSDGGDAGTSGSGTVKNTGDITTSGVNAFGVYVNVQAGAGGNAGLLAQGTGTGGPVSGSVSVGVGGSGGKGGEAKTASITNSGTITTSGHSGIGLFSQSLGGSGGAGGAVYGGSLDASAEGSGSVEVTVGGEGGAGGQAGPVNIDNTGVITTGGAYADGIFAQSIGGNGGHGGGSASGTLSAGTGSTFQSNVEIGGKGANGAIGGDVTVTNTNSITAKGGNAYGIYAQSIGGNGGKGALGVAALGTFAREKDEFFQVSANAQVGGYGGSGNHAGAVTVTNSGSITTTEDTSYAIYAQSVGGGGGEAGNAGAYSAGYTQEPKNSEGKKAEGKELSLSFTMGGNGGGGGHGDTVTVTHDGAATIKTSGTGSYGIYAQSIGGSGGSGGNGEPGLEDWVADIYGIYEKLHSAKEVWDAVKEFPESLLEGFSVNVGGGAGEASNGGDVIITNKATIATSGASGTAIYAQSIGGGGGSGGDGSQGLITSLTVAGSSAGGGDGGKVTVDSSGTITTSGDGAMGIHAQSIGGGGGNGGEVEGGLITELANAWETLGAQAFRNVDGQSGGDGGNGGDVTVTVSGTLTTTGKNAHGVWAHSIGGGGGSAQMIGGDSDDDSGKALIGSAGNKGDGGVVSVVVPGTITVKGEGAHGIFAQSVGGSDSYAKGVSVTVSGEVTAAGANGRAIMVQADESGSDPSSSDKTGGISQVTIEKGARVQVTSHQTSGAIAYVSGREIIGSDNKIVTSNLLTNHGEIYSPTYAVRTDGQSAFRFDNYGTMYGRVILTGDRDGKDGQTEITNQSGGVLYIADSNFGNNTSSVFTNEGTIKPGWYEDIRAVTITSGGTFNQSSSGGMIFDAEIGDDTQADNLTLSFDEGGKVEGTLAANWIGSDPMKHGASGTLSVLTLNWDDSGSFDASGLAGQTGGAVAYTVKPQTAANNSEDFLLDYTVDYTGEAAGSRMLRNPRAFGAFFASALDAIGTAGGSTTQDEIRTELAALGMRALNARSGGELSQTYSEHMVDEAAIGVSRALSASHAMQSLLRSCPELDPEDPKGFFRQRECVWGKAIGAVVQQDATDTMPGFDETVAGFAIGAQREISDRLFVEIAGMYEDVNIDGAGFSQDGQQFSAGVALKKEVGNFEFSGTATGGFYGYDHLRTYSATTGIHNANGDIDGRFASVEARIAAVFESAGTYIKPSASIGVTRTWQDGFTEEGSGPLNWQVGPLNHTAVYVRPMFEVGQAFDLADSAAVAFFRAGVTHQLTDPDHGITTSLVSGSLSLDDLQLASGRDRTQLEFEAGLDADLNDRLTFSVLGTTSLSESRQALAGQARLSLRF